MRILDIGCGRGAFAVGVLAKNDADVVGIDSSPDFLREAQKASPPNCQFVLADASSMCFRQASFDEIHCHHVLEHVPDLDDALDGIADALAPDGRLVVSFPNPLLERILGNLMNGYMGEGMHRRIIQPRDLKERLASRGISVRITKKRKFFIAVLLTYRFIRGLPYEPQSGLFEPEDTLTRFIDKISRWSLMDPREADFGKKKYFKGIMLLAKADESIFRHLYPHEYYMEAAKE